MSYAALSERVELDRLTVLGGFHPTDADAVPVTCKTLILLGPLNPDFWPTFKASPEWLDGRADPMDRWSTRVISTIAKDLGATPLFPFGGPPFLPFFTWALKTGRVHRSPIQLLVHDTDGLMVSFRGALALPNQIDLPDVPANPCETCLSKPCLTTCPVNALGAEYDVAACKGYLHTPEGKDCMGMGCAARRACPVSQKLRRPSAQSAYHMEIFKG